MLSEVLIVKRVKVKPAGSATAGVSVSFFLFQPAGARQVQSATHQELNFFLGGALSLSQYLVTHTSHTTVCNQLHGNGSTCV
jgi:hypothetical protein